MYSTFKLPNPSPMPITSHDSFSHIKTGVNSVIFHHDLHGCDCGRYLLTLKGLKMPKHVKNVFFQTSNFVNRLSRFISLSWWQTPYWNWKGSDPKSRVSRCWDMFCPVRVWAPGRGRVSGSTPSCMLSIRLLTSLLTLR